MNTSGHGGARVSAGRKPYKHRQIHVITSQPAPVVAQVDASLLEPPANLPDNEAAVWRKLAPLAVANSTLTLATADAFADLCEMTIVTKELLATIRQDGWRYLDVTVDGSGQEHSELCAHRLLSRYQAQMKALDQARKSFMLSPFGKPVIEVVRKKGPANPWAGIVQR